MLAIVEQSRAEMKLLVTQGYQKSPRPMPKFIRMFVEHARVRGSHCVGLRIQNNTSRLAGHQLLLRVSIGLTIRIRSYSYSQFLLIHDHSHFRIVYLMLEFAKCHTRARRR